MTSKLEHRPQFGLDRIAEATRRVEDASGFFQRAANPNCRVNFPPSQIAAVNAEIERLQAALDGLRMWANS